MMRLLAVFFILLTLNIGCLESPPNHPQSTPQSVVDSVKITDYQPITAFDKDTKTIHIQVALCDNKYQGIVPVPEKIGNGQDPQNNLYWGTPLWLPCQRADWIITCDAEFSESTKPQSE